ncbi:virulence-associated E family protein [Eubacteriales bacterium OttesenSCG-928-A19]|nr:virulence-associated E family protein [Eubacteriales bacterium OttesenSCG-928-A19]
MQLTHDRKLLIATGRSRRATAWKNTELLWSEFLEKLATTTRTRETCAEYSALPKAEKDNIKDIGGFVGGYLKGGKRNNASVVNRCMLCLDIDYADEALYDDLDMTFINAYALYSTHSHTPEKMRLRLIIPLSRTVTPDEYAAIARRVADDLTLSRFDPTTFEPSRLMYWPSTPEDGEYVFRYTDQPFLDPDAILSTYADWRDASLWPTTRPVEDTMKRTVAKQDDPLEKAGIIGAFCRAHAITDVLETTLKDFYTATGFDDRYTFVGGTTSGGLVIYDDKFAYSHHATDPASGKLCNSFDLVRLHLFTPGKDNADGAYIKDDTASVKAMQEYAASDDATKRLLAQERREQAESEFTDLTESDDTKASMDWQDGLEIDKQGKVKDTLGNIALILRSDPKLRGISYNLHRSGIDIRLNAKSATKLPWKQIKPGWNETDLGSILLYLDRVYGLYSPSKLKSILLAVAAERSYHPIRDYFDALPPWDGVPRVDEMFIQYLGAPDTAYTRAVARKMMVAAVARIYEPSIKFDSVVVLNGPQGMGKSSFFSHLGGKWFSDSLTIGDMKDKAAPEKLQGYWILELGELAGLKKMDVETVKAFITRQDDKFRHSYGYSVEDHPRQCIIVGSTNSGDGFLRDITGNRRFWPVTCTTDSPQKPWEVEGCVSLLWAEALVHYQEGEKLFLTPEVEQMASAEQTAALESDVREGMIAEYLDKLLPEDWDSMDLAERRGFLRGDTFTGGDKIGTVRKDTVSSVEIWAECFGKEPSAIRRSDTYDIFGMLMKIGGWEKYGGNKDSVIRRGFYGAQRCFVRVCE